MTVNQVSKLNKYPIPKTKDLFVIVKMAGGTSPNWTYHNHTNINFRRQQTVCGYRHTQANIIGYHSDYRRHLCVAHPSTFEALKKVVSDDDPLELNSKCKGGCNCNSIQTIIIVVCRLLNVWLEIVSCSSVSLSMVL